MVEIHEWMKMLRDKAQEEFGGRLKFLGLQGSYRRGEATEESDIDVVLVVNQLSLNDLAHYKALLKEMPEGEKACGFICGSEQLKHWPRYELFQFEQDTKGYLGNLRALMPSFDEEDIRQSVSIHAANLYHTMTNGYLKGGTEQVLSAGYKQAFFLLQELCARRGRPYAHTKLELATLLDGEDMRVLDVCMNWPALKSDLAARADYYYELLINWAGEILNSL
ncbi:MAG: nucleotidyltransferase domain-containing protein [Clostridia bacterium]